MNTPVSFEIAKLLKEKGFDLKVKQRFFIAENIDSDRFPFLQEECALHNWNEYDDFSTSYYSAPTISEVVMWLYEKHGIWVGVQPNEPYLDDDWCFTIFNNLKNNKSLEGYNSPTEAYEAAIEYTLNNLI